MTLGNWLWQIVFLAALGVVLVPMLLAKKALGCYNAGRPDLCVRWARRALVWPAVLPIRVSVRHAIGLGLSEQGHLAEAQAEYQRAYELAAARKPGSELAARSLVLLGTTQANQGYLEEALTAARQVAEWSPKARRDALIAQSDWLRVLGRWDEAVQALQWARQTVPLSSPVYERRQQGIIALGLAWTEAAAAQARGDRGAADRAWESLTAAQPVFAGDKKLSLWCDATAAWLLALRGQPDEAGRVLAQTRAGLAGFAESRATQLGGLSMLGRAATLRGDYAGAGQLWTEYLAQRPTRPSQTLGLYGVGECLRLSGERAAAEHAFRQAVALGIDTYSARCAEERLTEMGLPAEPRPERPAAQDTVWPPPPRAF